MGCKNRHRPVPLRINKDSQRIKKSPLHPPLVQRREPVIIHTRSPEIIQTNPTDFMSLVQRLTGRSIHAGAVNAQGRDHFSKDSVAAIHSPGIHAEITRILDQADEGFSISPENPLPQVKAEERGFDPRYPEAICLNPAAASSEYDIHTISSAGSFSTFTSPRLWSPIPSPSIMFQQILAELPSLSPGLQGLRDNLLSPFPDVFARNST